MFQYSLFYSYFHIKLVTEEAQRTILACHDGHGTAKVTDRAVEASFNK